MKITDLGMNGEGVAREGGKVYFVKNALPGEEVKVQITEEKSKFCKGYAAEIMKKSADRTEPLCPYYGECGGCDLQHMSYGAQLKFKKDLVKNTLKKVAGIDAQVSEVVPSNNEYFYRNKSVFPVFEEGGCVRLGMFKGGTNKVVETAECKIAQMGINGILKLTASFLKNRKAEGLKYLVVRQVNEQFLITLVVIKEPSYLQEYVEFLEKNVKNFVLDLNFYINSNQILSPHFKTVCGAGAIKASEMGLNQIINSASFMQVNGSVKEKLYRAVLSEINGETVVDAYCGAGLLSGILAQRAEYVYGVEIVKPAIESAKKLAQENGISNATFICGDCATILPKLLKKIDGAFTLVLDPPRKGCDKKVLEAALNAMPQKIVYISCNPISLAQNLKTFMGKYKIVSLQPFDMFPQTANVETLCVLQKNL